MRQGFHAAHDKVQHQCVADTTTALFVCANGEVHLAGGGLLALSAYGDVLRLDSSSISSSNQNATAFHTPAQSTRSRSGTLAAAMLPRQSAKSNASASAVGPRATHCSLSAVS